MKKDNCKCELCGRKTKKGKRDHSQNICWRCKATQWIGDHPIATITMIFGGSLLFSGIRSIASNNEKGEVSNQAIDLERTDGLTSATESKQAKELHRAWSEKLADINEAIYEANEELVVVKAERNFAESNLKKAQERGADPCVLQSHQEQFDYYDNAYSKLQADLESYHEHLKEHYSKEPNRE